MPQRTQAQNGGIRLIGRALPSVCRPAGWIAIWRKIGTLSVLSRKGRALY
jgi:hypothetical protein